MGKNIWWIVQNRIASSWITFKKELYGGSSKIGLHQVGLLSVFILSVLKRLNDFVSGVSASMPPKILYQSPERDVPFRERDRLELPCVAYGNPLPR